MGIDRIGKGTPPQRLGEADATSSPSPPAGPLGAAGTKVSGAPVSAAASDALARLRAGTISFDAYLDLKVDEATHHLGLLPASELAMIRAELRDRLTTDPMLIDLARTAASAAASSAKSE